MTQRQLAGQELTAAEISRIETGRLAPSPRTVRVLARKLDSSPEHLLHGITPDQLDALHTDLAAARYALFQGQAHEAVLRLDRLIADPILRRLPDLYNDACCWPEPTGSSTTMTGPSKYWTLCWPTMALLIHRGCTDGSSSNSATPALPPDDRPPPSSARRPNSWLKGASAEAAEAAHAALIHQDPAAPAEPPRPRAGGTVNLARDGRPGTPPRVVMIRTDEVGARGYLSELLRGALLSARPTKSCQWLATSSCRWPEACVRPRATDRSRAA
jgi:hypothetical protein